ncbi:MAG: sensor histidine kinase [Ginsengibacter sp.]
MKAVRFFKIIALIVFIHLHAKGQGTKFVFNVLRTSNGLSSNNIKGVYQDKKGFIWVATPNGLQRFDGKSFVNFPFSNSTEFNSKPVNQIIGDKDGNIWLKVGESYGIFNPANYSFNETKVEGGTNDKVQSYLTVDSANNIAIIYLDVRIYFYDKKVNLFTSKMPFVLPKDFTLSSYVYYRGRKQFWLSGTKGIVIYDETLKQIIDQNNSKIEILDRGRFYAINRLTIDKSGRLWIFYWPESNNKPQLIASYDLKNNKLIKAVYSVSTKAYNYNEANNILQLRNGQLWISGRNMMARYDNDSGVFINYKSSNDNLGSINYTDINATMEDREGNLWIASDDGLYTANTNIRSIEILKMSDSSGKFVFTDFLVDSTKIRLTTWGAGTVIYDKIFKYFNNNGLRLKEGDRFLQWSIVKSNLNHKFYIGCQHGWLKEWDETGKSSYYNLPIFNGKTIRQVGQDQSGNLWFGTHEGKLIMFNPWMGVANENFVVKQDFKTIINRIMFDKSGKLWIATGTSGLIQYDAARNIVLRHYTNDQSNYKTIEVGFSDITQVNDSLFALAGSNFYLLNSRSGRIKQYSFYDGLSSNNIESMTTDNASNVWMYTTNGICKFNFRTNSFTRFTEKDGFLPFEETDNVAKKLADGRIMIAGGSQIICFDPTEFTRKTLPPKVTITDIKLFNSYVPLDSLLHEKPIRFKPQQNSITIYFSSLSYIQGDKLLFYYRLKGGGEEWQLSNTDHFVNYSLLPPGNYTFEVKCKNEQGDSSEITSLSFVIITPFYLTWWFISLCVLIIVIDAIYIYRSKENKRKAIEQIRSKVARDLHDDMGSTLSTINILSAMAKSKLSKEPESSGLYISKISENSQRMMEAMDDIVWSIKPSNDSMQKISSRMREFSTSV